MSGTVEILFRTHTDAPRGVADILCPAGVQVTGYGRLPISGQSPWPSSVYSVPLAKRVVNEVVVRVKT